MLPPESILRNTLFAVNMSGVGRTGSGTGDIVIDRWSSDAEREQLIKVFLEKGPEKLLDALQDTKRVGYIRDPQSLGWDLRFARQVQGEDGGRRIIVVTDRPIGFAEARNRPRTMDYPFTLIELHLDKDGNGEGKASVATKITYDKKKGTFVWANNVRPELRYYDHKYDKAIIGLNDTFPKPAAVDGRISLAVPEQALAWLDALRPGDIASADLFARPEAVERVCSPSFVSYFIFRDPRDVVVSHVFYVTDMEARHVHHDYYASLPYFNARLNASIQGRSHADVEFPDIGARFAPYLGWLDRPEVLCLHFEELIQDRPGTYEPLPGSSAGPCSSSSLKAVNS